MIVLTHKPSNTRVTQFNRKNITEIMVELKDKQQPINMFLLSQLKDGIIESKDGWVVSDTADVNYDPEAEERGEYEIGSEDYPEEGAPKKKRVFVTHEDKMGHAANDGYGDHIKNIEAAGLKCTFIQYPQYRWFDFKLVGDDGELINTMEIDGVKRKVHLNVTIGRSGRNKDNAQAMRFNVYIDGKSLGAKSSIPEKDWDKTTLYARDMAKNMLALK